MVNWSGKNGEIFLRLSGSSVSDSVQVVCVSKDFFFLSLAIYILAELGFPTYAKTSYFGISG